MLLLRVLLFPAFLSLLLMLSHVGHGQEQMTEGYLQRRLRAIRAGKNNLRLLAQLERVCVVDHTGLILGRQARLLNPQTRRCGHELASESDAPGGE
jgi:hypothetical protein